MENTIRKKYTWKGLSISCEAREFTQEIRMLFGFKLNDCIRIVKDQELIHTPRDKEDKLLIKLLERYCFGVRVEDLENKE